MGGGEREEEEEEKKKKKKKRNVLRVEETRISRRRVDCGRSGKSRGGCGGGGSSYSSSSCEGGPAVRTEGTGALSGVRALPLPCGGALLWCEVDAEKPAVGGFDGGGGRCSPFPYPFPFSSLSPHSPLH